MKLEESEPFEESDMEAKQVIERGELLFTKKLSRGPKIGSDITYTFKTPIAVLVMGGTKDVEWDEKLLDQSLASLGIFYSDDIAECLGEDAREKLVKFLKEKLK